MSVDMHENNALIRLSYIAIRNSELRETMTASVDVIENKCTYAHSRDVYENK